MELKSRKTAEDTANWILEREYEEVVVIDGFDDAFVGCTTDSVAVYNVDRCIEIICEDLNLSMEDAIEHFEYNVMGAYLGPKTPLFLDIVVQ
jgi:hypothetical protein